MSNNKEKQRKQKVIMLSDEAIAAGLEIVATDKENYRSFSRVAEKAILKLSLDIKKEKVLSDFKTRGY